MMERWWSGATQGWLVWRLYRQLLIRHVDHTPHFHFCSPWPLRLGEGWNGLQSDGPSPLLLSGSAFPTCFNFYFSLRSELKRFFLRILLPVGPRLSVPQPVCTIIRAT